LLKLRCNRNFNYYSALNSKPLTPQATSWSHCLRSKLLFSTFNVSRSYVTTTACDVQKYLNLTLNPWFITGFTDAEGCFTASILKRPNRSTGWLIQLTFQIKLHIRDLIILKNIQANLGGTLSIDKNYCVLRVRNLTQLAEVIKFFDKYPLITQKKRIIYYLKKFLKSWS
jgi:hypothetical protein